MARLYAAARLYVKLLPATLPAEGEAAEGAKLIKR
jgi:hypothetical protein